MWDDCDITFIWLWHECKRSITKRILDVRLLGYYWNYCVIILKYFLREWPTICNWTSIVIGGTKFTINYWEYLSQTPLNTVGKLLLIPWFPKEWPTIFNFTIMKIRFLNEEQCQPGCPKSILASQIILNYYSVLVLE